MPINQSNNFGDYPTGPAVSVGWYRRTWGRVVIFFLALFVVLGAAAGFLFVRLIQQSQRQTSLQWLIQEDAKDPARQKIEKSGVPAFGNQQAGLVVVEFGDFQCPYCREEFPVIREVMLEHQQDIKYIFRPFPVYENSMDLFQTAWCANDQGRFWPLYDKLFLSTSETVSSEELQVMAKRAGINLQLLNDCVKSEKHKQEILNSIEEAGQLEISGTPTFFINGHKIQGVISKAQWEEIIAKFKELTSGR